MTLAGALRFDERGANTCGRGHTGGVIPKSGPQCKRLLTFWHREMSDPGARPERRHIKSRLIGIRALEAVTRERAINQFRIDLAEAGKIEPRSRQTSGANIGEEDVSICGELPQNLLAFFRTRIEHHGFFATIVEVEHWIVG